MSFNYKVEVLIKEKEIKDRIKSLSYEINEFYKNSKKLLVVGLLRGSFVFIADLAREIKTPVEIDFMTVSSYGNSMSSSENVRILSDLNTDIKNIDVLLVEDIIDTGYTLFQVIKLLKQINFLHLLFHLSNLKSFCFHHLEIILLYTVSHKNEFSRLMIPVHYTFY